jgi:hypothetical protein
VFTEEHRWLPKYLSSDNDPLYRFHQWQANLPILEVTKSRRRRCHPATTPRLSGWQEQEHPGGSLAVADGSSPDDILAQANSRNMYQLLPAGPPAIRIPSSLW